MDGWMDGWMDGRVGGDYGDLEEQTPLGCVVGKVFI